MTAGARRAAQQDRIAAMPLGRRIGTVIVGGVGAILACLVVNLLLSGDANPGLAIAIGVAITLVIGYQYLVQPARNSSARGSDQPTG